MARHETHIFEGLLDHPGDGGRSSKGLILEGLDAEKPLGRRLTSRRPSSHAHTKVRLSTGQNIGGDVEQRIAPVVRRSAITIVPRHAFLL